MKRSDYRATFLWLTGCRDLRAKMGTASNEEEAVRMEQECADRRVSILLAASRLPDLTEAKAIKLYYADGCSLAYLAYRLTGSTLLARWLLRRAVKHLAEITGDHDRGNG